jgi:hypothetical protein
MIRTIFIPDSEQIILPIPETYVGTELEILVFPVKDAASDFVNPGKTAVFGCAKGKIKMADDFDAPLKDFMEYMH